MQIGEGHCFFVFFFVFSGKIGGQMNNIYACKSMVN